MLGLCTPAFYQLIFHSIMGIIAFITNIVNGGMIWGIIYGFFRAIGLAISIAISQFLCSIGLGSIAWLFFALNVIGLSIRLIITILYLTGVLKAEDISE